MACGALKPLLFQLQVPLVFFFEGYLLLLMSTSILLLITSEWLEEAHICLLQIDLQVLGYGFLHLMLHC